MVEKSIKDLEQAILNYNIESAKYSAKKILDEGIDTAAAIKAATKAIREIGEKFHKGILFLPHLVMAGDAMMAASKILEEGISKEKRERLNKGNIVIGTVQGDIHNIGKNIVATMLKSEGFVVYDLGEDVPIERFIEKAKEIDADIIAASSLMTMTMPVLKELIEELERKDLGNKFKVMIGGGSITQEWANEIGADGYGRDGPEAAEVAKRILGA
ncbi:MAG: cobalamin-dependent protein [Candidatus Bathyarchaeota archaeon]|nr:cobalamin-dependent protein [Candidatus Bathyarchaeota archaeon]